MSANLTPIYGEAAPKSRTRDLPLMGEGTCHRTKCDLLLVERMLMTGLACVHPNHVKRPMVKEATRIRKGEKPLPLLPPRKPRVKSVF
ncbi:hypothetical protein FF1_032086 [Malus domestica]